MSLETKLLIVNMTMMSGKPSRDNGGVFELTEMAAEPASDWFLRAMQFLARSGMDVPPNIFAAGPAGFAAIGIGTALAGLSKTAWFEFKPLLDELKTCVTSYQPPGGTVALRDWRVISGQIKEAATILMLYEEVVSLSLGFSLAERLSNFRQQVSMMMTGNTPNTETSIPESAG